MKQVPALLRTSFLALVTAGAAAWTGTASAQSLSLTALPADVVLGQDVQLRLDFNFAADPTLGGGVDLVFDPLRLQYLGFSFNAALGDDVGFRRQPDLEDGRLVGLAFGHFNGLGGPGTVGSYSFRTLAEGPAALTLQPNVVPAGHFISLATFSPQTVQWGTAELTVSAVPAPASLWTFLLGGVALACASRGRRRIGFLL